MIILKFTENQRYIVSFLLFWYILSVFCLCYARQIRKPNSFVDNLIDSLTVYSIDEVIQPGFFVDNWEILTEGIKVNFEAGGFLEIRRLEEYVIVQLFGELSEEDERKFSNLGGSEFLENIKFIDFSYIDLEKEPLEVYSILSLSKEDFEIVMQDVLEEGNGSGSKVAESNGQIENIRQIAKTIGMITQSDFFEGNSFHVSKIEFIRMCKIAKKNAFNLMQNIEEQDIDKDNQRTKVSFCESIRDNLNKIISYLNSEGGDMIYRILYREFLRKIQIMQYP